MKKLIVILVSVVAVIAMAADPKPHSTVTYAIVPVKDITKEMVELCAQTSMDTLRKSTNGTLAVLKWVEWKKPTDPLPPQYTNNIPLTASQLEYNEKLSKYRWAHTTTPDLLLKYKQFTYAQILVELAKPEWTADDVAAKEITP